MTLSETSFQGRLFGPGLAGGGAQASGQWLHDILVMQHATGIIQVPASELRLEAAGFNIQQLRLSWHAENGEHAFFIDEPASMEKFLAHAPVSVTGQAGKVGRQQRRLETRFKAAFSLYSLIVVWPLVLLVVFLLNMDRIAAWAADQVPVAYEEKIGSMVLAQARAQTRLIESGPAHEAVKAIGQKLTTGSRYSYQWFIAEGREVNAFAAPGGIIVVYTGLIAQTSQAEELAGILAHEVAHVEQRHSLKKLGKSAGLSILLALALGDWSGSAAGSWLASLTELKFSRDAEMEADSEGVQRLVKAGIDPAYMVQFFAGLAQKEGKTAALSVLSTHPASQERMQALQRQIALLPEQRYEPIAMEWNRIKQSLQ